MSKQKRKQTAKRHKREKAARAAVRDTGISPSLAMLIGSMERFAPYLTLSNDPDAAIAAAAERQRQAMDAIVAATAQADVFDVLEAVRIRGLMTDPDTYRESEHGADVSMFELLALILISRGTRTATTSNGEDPGPAEVLGALQVQLQDLMDAGQMLNLFTSDRGEPLHRVSFGTRLREVAVRNAIYPHMLDDTLTALFDGQAIETACRSALGCTVNEIRRVFAGLQQLVINALGGRFEALEEWRQILDRTNGEVADLASQEIDQARALLAQVSARPGSNATHTPEAIAAMSGLGLDVVQVVLDLFSTPMTARSPADVVQEFFEGTSPLRTRPLVATPDGQYALVHQALMTPAIRERVEDVLRGDKNAWNVYSKHRGTYLEGEAARLIATHMPGSVQYLGFEYFVPASADETNPASFTKLVEGDGLLILDDVAVIIEAKAVALRPRSRTGDPLRLRQDLRRIITDAAEQADRLRRRILDDKGLRLRDETWLDLSAVREVHTVAVSLEDLSGIATVTSELVVSGLLNTDDLPWTVSIHDLRIINELVDRPAELLLYLRRRTEPGTTRCFHAVDELDFFLHFLAAQLYVEPDPDAVQRELPQLGEPPTKNKRRYREQGLELISSRTDPLDAWYFYQQGIRTTQANKPRMKADPDLLLMIDDLARRGDPGWFAMTAALLNFDTASQHRCAVAGPRLAAQTRADGLPHSLAMPAGTRRGDSVLFIWATTTPGLPTAASLQRLHDYTTAKKHQLQLDRALGFLYDHRTGGLLDTYYDNRSPEPDPALDSLGTQIGLKGPEAFQSAPPARRPRKR
ncbi:hypothetical protein ABZX92_44050 [Lentzea sp. NPDC006480]|uniref:hypothetical protein n=1 Tax=Lentzea sp. NPDC006480 TaxID=3157176 RepID=UPI0033BCB13F